jgi:phage shock protein A
MRGFSEISNKRQSCITSLEASVQDLKEELKYQSEKNHQLEKQLDRKKQEIKDFEQQMLSIKNEHSNAIEEVECRVSELEA